MSKRGVRDIPPPLELECLSVLWRLGESNVRTVQETLAVSRPLAYTTVMTMLERLAKKQLVSRRKTGRHFVYAAQVDRDTVRHSAVRNLVDSLFDASAADLTAFLEAGAGQPVSQAATSNADDRYGEEDQSDGEIDAVLL